VVVDSTDPVDESDPDLRKGDRRLIRRVSARYAWPLAGIFSAIYAVVAVRRHLRMRTTSFDLGIFEQAVRSYAHLQWPTSSLKGPDYPLLGDHFHPILAFLAPFYLIAPTPITLLVAQALLLGCSVVPIAQLAIQRLGPRNGILIGVSYGFSWGLQNAVGFDFHEVCFAVPLLAWSMVRLAQRRFRQAVLIAAPLILVKEDLPLTLAAIGVVVFLLGNRKWGAVTVIAGVAATAVIVLLIIPSINPVGDNPYLSTVAVSGQGAVDRLFTPAGIKAGTVAALVALGAGLAVRSPLALVVVPTIAWRFWAQNESYWGTRYHYSAVLMPIIFVALLDALDRLAPSFHGRMRSVPTVAVVVSLTASVLLGARLSLADMVRPKVWHTNSAVAMQKRLLRQIPDGATVAAPNQVGPQLTNRADVYLYPWYPTSEVRPEWVLANDPPKSWPLTSQQEGLHLRYLRTGGTYREVSHQGDLYLFQRVK
jgi:uncharacterized membrane protein